MEETIRQVAGLLLGAIPTAVLLLSLYVIYHNVLHKPLLRVLAQRHALTEGAVEQAKADIAAAAAKTADYEERLREAKLVVFKQQEARRQTAQQARADAIAQARVQADTQVKAARKQLDKDVADAKSSLQGDAQRIAAEIVRTVLRPSASASPATGGAR